jgi:hypothetical protein
MIEKWNIGRQRRPADSVNWQHYVGLDVSLETISIGVIDDRGTAVWRGKCASTPEVIIAAIRAHAPAAVRISLETGQLSNWPRHAKAALSLQIKGPKRKRPRNPSACRPDFGERHAMIWYDVCHRKPAVVQSAYGLTAVERDLD